MTDWCRRALELGFDHAAPVEAAALECLPEVREMCAADRCRAYNRCWTCPPGCGTLEDCAARLSQYRRGILVQTTGHLEDDFDVEAMLDTEARHKARFAGLAKEIRSALPRCLPLGAGSCTRCTPCTYPDAPCRFPQEAIVSMEAFGLLVAQVCQRAGLEYYYGPRTITYTSAVLLD